MVGLFVSFWEGVFSRAMFVSGWYQLPKTKRPPQGTVLYIFFKQFFSLGGRAKLFVFGLENNAKNDWHSNNVCETFPDANKALLLIHDYSTVGGNQSLSIKNQPHEFREKFFRIL